MNSCGDVIRKAGLALVALAALLGGCSELDRRGGLTAQIEDRILFRATGKGHRVLRSYVMAESLSTVAANRGIPAADKLTLMGRILQTHDLVQEAFICAYESYDGCAFFDEKMARLDYSIYKMALLILITDETRQLVARVKDGMLPKIPVVGPLVRAAESAGQTAINVVDAGLDTSQIIDTLLNLGYQSADTLGPLFPLYRDAQELDMRVALDMLARRCARDKIGAANQSKMTLRQWIDTSWDGEDFRARASKPECGILDEGLALYNGGNGNLGAWRQFTRQLDENRLGRMTPTDEHFIEVSRLGIAGCNKNFGAAGTSSPTGFPLEQCSDSTLYAKELKGSTKPSEVVSGSYRMTALAFAECRARAVRTLDDANCRRGTLKLSHTHPPSASG